METKKKIQKHPGGRPKKTLDNLPKNWKDIILKIKKEGGSDVEVRVALNISVDLWERFIKEIKEFSETIKKGDDLCNAWWLKKGRTNLENRKFSAVLWYMNMKNRFGWKDKSEVEVGFPKNLIDLIKGIKNDKPPEQK